LLRPKNNRTSCHYYSGPLEIRREDGIRKGWTGWAESILIRFPFDVLVK